MQTSSYMQAGGTLLATALRDPADIITGSTLWDFIQLTENFCAYLCESERESFLYRQLVACVRCIEGPLHTDVTSEGDAFRFGSAVLEAFAAYVEQATLVMVFLLNHRFTSQLDALVQQFELVLSKVIQEIVEVPGENPVQLALAAFKQCQADMTNEVNRP